MVEVYYSDIRDCLARQGALVATLPPARARYMRSFLREEDRLRCLAGWLLMARIMGQDGILDESAIQRGPQGKPSRVNGPYFNLAHSGNYVLLAVGNVELGADIEQWRDDDYRALAGLAFHPTERAWLAGHMCARSFFDMWTAKESYLKWLGTGLLREPASFSLTLRGHTAHVQERPNLHLGLYDDITGYSIAVCAASELPERPSLMPLP